MHPLLHIAVRTAQSKELSVVGYVLTKICKGGPTKGDAINTESKSKVN